MGSMETRYISLEDFRKGPWALAALSHLGNCFSGAFLRIQSSRPSETVEVAMGPSPLALPPAPSAAATCSCPHPASSAEEC